MIENTHLKFQSIIICDFHSVLLYVLRRVLQNNIPQLGEAEGLQDEVMSFKLFLFCLRLYALGHIISWKLPFKTLYYDDTWLKPYCIYLSLNM